MAFETLKIQAPLTLLALVEIVNRFQQNVVKAFDAISRVPPLPVLPIVSTATTNTYIVKPVDIYIVVDARGGPMKLILPAPTGATQSVSVKNAYAGGAVSIVQSDGNKLGDGTASIPLDALASAHMVNTGKAWFNFGA